MGFGIGRGEVSYSRLKHKAVGNEGLTRAAVVSFISAPSTRTSYKKKEEAANPSRL